MTGIDPGPDQVTRPRSRPAPAGSRVARLARIAGRTVVLLGLAAVVIVVVSAVTTAPTRPDGGSWGVIARCESGGNWNIGSGVDYAGGPRFTPGPDPDAAGDGPVGRQVEVAEAVLRSQGIRTWPRCGPADGSARFALDGVAQAARR